jgi:hypothetical protein
MVDRTGLFVAPVPGNPPVGSAPIDGRLVLGALFGTAGQCLKGGTFTQSSTTMAFTGVPSVYQIPDTANAGAVYEAPLDAATVSPAAGPASGSRIDSIYVLQQDYEKGAATSRVVLGLQAGVATTGTATAPAVPAGALRVANILVPANATKATDCSLGYVTPPATLATPGPITGSKTLLDLMPGQYVGQRSTAGGVDFRWNGTIWKPWDSDWVNYSPQIGGLSGALNADPGWGFSRQPKWRYVAGRVACRGVVRMANSQVIGNPGVYVQMPTAIDLQSEPVGNFFAKDASSTSNLQLAAFWNGTFLAFAYWAATGTGPNSGIAQQNLFGNTPVTWTDGDLWSWDLTYDPA